MKKTITLTACNRPEYLKSTLDSLSRVRGLSDYKLYCKVEPINNEVINICKSIDFIDKEVIVNDSVKGVKWNPYEALEYVFEIENSDINVYLEDDVLVSEDILEMSDWYSALKNREDYLCLQYMNYGSTNKNKEAIVEYVGFSALGFVVTKYSWVNRFKKWWNIEPDVTIAGWDNNVVNKLNSLECDRQVVKTLMPTFSRTNHIGEVGEHVTEDMVDLNESFRNLIWASNGIEKQKYFVVKG